MNSQYPIGKFTIKEVITSDDVKRWIGEIEEAPMKLFEAVNGLTEEQLATPYRQDGWKLSQVVHHLADAHMNGYMRVKLGLTEEQPTIKSYDEVSWAKLSDNSLPIEVSLNIFSSIHKRLVVLLKSLDEKELKKTINHPDSGFITIEKLIATYAWHGKHHIAHITSLREQKGW
ncbi:YfiT family bacillithiol transferase [Paenibacillus sp. MAH-36]|uniref:Putative metal-dependent hydrolase RQP52_27800 n=1 Tax=Paenibacillus violae TaxID=3077234 RepID=A0ABU3RKS0_9BACL|nr:putative metal-dependent hydrolase [Paenibacillus sp. PFR10]MDU0204891.1 putative metal-dependent hydrolase [Paenibacillus sp. PFR10]